MFSLLKVAKYGVHVEAGAGSFQDFQAGGVGGGSLVLEFRKECIRRRCLVGRVVAVRDLLQYCNRLVNGGSESSRAVRSILLPVLTGPVLKFLGFPVSAVGVSVVLSLPSTSSTS